MPNTLLNAIARQRTQLSTLLSAPLARVAADCLCVWDDDSQLNEALQAGFRKIPYCSHLYVMDINSIQRGPTITRNGLFQEDAERDRSQRPYMREAVPADGFLLSEAYIGLRTKRPSLTAIQLLRRHDEAIGFLGADFKLSDLPITQDLYEEPKAWRQIKGDPAIRSGLFAQTRAQSRMDEQLNDVLAVIEELMTDHGVFHTILHFSSSRATIWLHQDPYRYRLLEVDALTDPDVCLAYSRRDYPNNALVARSAIRPVLDIFQQLRLMDETIYLRSASLNIFNGTVGLTFSCDGSHYIQVEEFLTKGMDFWIGHSG